MRMVKEINGEKVSEWFTFEQRPDLHIRVWEKGEIDLKYNNESEDVPPNEFIWVISELKKMGVLKDST